MNRIQAKIYSKLTPEEVRALPDNEDFNPECYAIMKAFGDGARLTFNGIEEGAFGFNFNFADDTSAYKIVPETHIVNGIEVPMSLRVKPEHGAYYWCITDTRISLERWRNLHEDNERFRLGNCFATEEDAQVTFNAIWKVEE